MQDIVYQLLVNAMLRIIAGSFAGSYYYGTPSPARARVTLRLCAGCPLASLLVASCSQGDPPPRGSGNVFRDFDRPNASVEQTRAILAAEIIRALDKQGLSTREAEKLTGVGHSEFSRIRNARLSRFTLDRMITILEKLDGNIEVGLTFRPRRNKMRDGLHI